MSRSAGCLHSATLRVRRVELSAELHLGSSVRLDLSSGTSNPNGRGGRIESCDRSASPESQIHQGLTSGNSSRQRQSSSAQATSNLLSKDQISCREPMTSLPFAGQRQLIAWSHRTLGVMQANSNTSIEGRTRISTGSDRITRCRIQPSLMGTSGPLHAPRY